MCSEVRHELGDSWSAEDGVVGSLEVRNFELDVLGAVVFPCLPEGNCRMDLPGPTTLVGTRTDYSVGPWEYSTCAARYLLA
jgi:hypothetical protein